MAEERYGVVGFPFAIIPANLASFALKVGDGGIALYVALASFAGNETRDCWPSHTTLAEMLGVTTMTIMRRMEKLKEAGLITVEHRYAENGRQTSNLYHLGAGHEGGNTGVKESVTPVLGGRVTPVLDELDLSELNLKEGEAPAAPPRPSDGPESKKETEPKKAPKQIPKAVLAIQKAANRYPAKTWWKRIEAAIGENERDLERWEKHVFDWVGMGWNPVNIKGMLESYEGGGIDAKRDSRASPETRSVIVEDPFTGERRKVEARL